VRKTSHKWFSFLILVVGEQLLIHSFSVVLLSKPSNSHLSSVSMLVHLYRLFMALKVHSEVVKGSN